MALLRREFRSLKKPRTVLRGRTLSRRFRLRFGVAVTDLITHPARAALAQFISDREADDPHADRVVHDLIEALYEFGSTGRALSAAQVNGPLVVMTAHRAKGLEFEHVLILDGGHWQDADDAERRLFYVAMTRAKQTLTICHSDGGGHAFISALHPHALRTDAGNHRADAGLSHRTWMATLADVVLSWPGYFSGKAPVHGAISRLDIGDSLQLQARSDGKVGWELADMRGTVVGRMAQKFVPPKGTVIAVRVAAILVRKAKGDEVEKLPCASWELVLPEIEVS